MGGLSYTLFQMFLIACPGIIKKINPDLNGIVFWTADSYIVSTSDIVSKDSENKENFIVRELGSK